MTNDLGRNTVKAFQPLLLGLALTLMVGCGDRHGRGEAERIGEESHEREQRTPQSEIAALVKQYTEAQNGYTAAVASRATRDAPELTDEIRLWGEMRTALAELESTELLYLLAEDPSRISTRIDDKPWVYYELTSADRESLRRDSLYSRKWREHERLFAEYRALRRREEVTAVLQEATRSDEAKSALAIHDAAVRSLAMAVRGLSSGALDRGRDPACPGPPVQIP